MSATVVSPRLSSIVRELSKQVHRKLGGTYQPKEYEVALDAALKKVDLNQESVRTDIVRTFVRADIASRSNIDPFVVDAKTGVLQPALFDERTFERGVIRLGNGYLVKMREATAQEWLVRQLHQQEAAAASQQAATTTTRWLQTEPGVLLIENPRMKTFEALRQLTIWPLVDLDPATADDATADDDVEGE